MQLIYIGEKYWKESKGMMGYLYALSHEKCFLDATSISVCWSDVEGYLREGKNINIRVACQRDIERADEKSANIKNEVQRI